MRSSWGKICGLGLAALAALQAQTSRAELLTADRAVQIALKTSSQVINAEAGVVQARSGVLGAYAGVLPQISASVTRSNSVTGGQRGGRVLGAGVSFGLPSDEEGHGTTPSVGGTWSLVNLSSWAGLSAARTGLKAARLSRESSRQQVAFAARQQFYEVVKAIHLAGVQAAALRRAQDDERRVQALFEVGSVSKSDVLKARVATAQSELDSLAAHNDVTVQRILLAERLGITEAEVGDVDTTLAAARRDFDESALLAEAAKARPDLMSAEAQVRAGQANLRAAQFARLPFVAASGSMDFSTSGRSVATFPGGALSTSVADVDRQFSASLSLNWNLLDEFTNSSRIASSRASLIRARETRDALRRNLASDVHRALLAYQQAVEGEAVARRGLESAEESFKLTQQKYNVGSATILELVDAQVQLQSAQGTVISALAAIRVAEADIDRVRGKSE